MGFYTGDGEGVWDGYTGHWLGLLFCFFILDCFPAERVWRVCAEWVKCTMMRIVAIPVRVLCLVCCVLTRIATQITYRRSKARAIYIRPC